MKAQDWFGLFIRCIGTLVFLWGIYLSLMTINLWLSTGFRLLGGTFLSSLLSLVTGKLILRHADDVVRYTYPEDRNR